MMTTVSVHANDAYYSGTQKRKRTTKGWTLLVHWKDGSQDWIPLKDMKDAYPVQVAEYAVANKIADAPAFAWWVPHVMRKRDSTIMKVKSRYWKRTHKFGIRLPHTIEEALEIDKETGTTFWRDALDKELRNMSGAYELLDKAPIGSRSI